MQKRELLKLSELNRNLGRTDNVVQRTKQNLKLGLNLMSCFMEDEALQLIGAAWGPIQEHLK